MLHGNDVSFALLREPLIDQSATMLRYATRRAVTVRQQQVPASRSKQMPLEL